MARKFLSADLHLPERQGELDAELRGHILRDQACIEVGTYKPATTPRLLRILGLRE